MLLYSQYIANNCVAKYSLNNVRDISMKQHLNSQSIFRFPKTTLKAYLSGLNNEIERVV